MKPIKIYSPNQISVGSFWGGPIAPVYFLWRNYIALEKEKEARQTLIYGSLFNLILLSTLPFLPDNLPSTVIPIMYSLIANQIAISTQLKKEAIANDPVYTFESNWKIFGIGVLTLLLFLIMAMVVGFGMSMAGFISVE